MNDQLLSSHVRPWLKGLIVTSILLQPLSALAEVECFAVADNDKLNNSADVMVYLSLPGDQVLKKGGPTGTEHIEAIAFGPGGNPLYAANGGELGTLHQELGEFTPIGTFGTGMGVDCADSTVKEITFGDVDALAFYRKPGSEVYELYGVQRREHGDNALPDLLFRIPLDENNQPVPNADGGYYVPGAFGGNDYVCVTGGQQDVDDMTQCLDEDSNSCDFEAMYITLNDGNGLNSSVAKLNVTSGSVSDVIPLTWDLGNDTPVGIMAISNDLVQDLEGVASSPNGKVYGVTGNGGDMKGTGTQNYLLELDLNDGIVAIIDSIIPPDERQQDHEAVSCRDNSSVLEYCYALAIHDEGVNDSQVFAIYPAIAPGSSNIIDMGANSTVEPYGAMHKKHDLEGLALLEDKLYASSGSDQRKGIPDGAIYEIETVGEQHDVTLLFETGYSETSALGARNGKELWAFARGGTKANPKTQAGPLLIDLDNKSAQLVQEFPYQDPDIQALAWSADGNTLYLASENKVKMPGKNRLVKVSEITGYAYDEANATPFTKIGHCQLLDEVEALEGQANGLLLVAIDGKEGLGILAINPTPDGDGNCPIVASRKFENILNYNDIETIALSCPSLLDENSGSMQINVQPPETLPSHIIQGLFKALQSLSSEVGLEEQDGDVIVEVVQNMTNEFFIAHVLGDSPLISQELTGTIENAQLTFVDGLAILSYTIDGTPVTLELAPKPLHPAQLLAALQGIDPNATIDESGMVEMMLSGEKVCGRVDFIYIPPELVEDMLMPGASSNELLFLTLFTDPPAYPDVAGDGITPDYLVRYIEGSAQLLHRRACPN